MTRNDTKAQLEVIWDALFAYRADLIPEGDEQYDNTWSEICTAMAWIEEDLSEALSFSSFQDLKGDVA